MGEEIPKLTQESKREALVKHLKHVWGSKHINNRGKLTIKHENMGNILRTETNFTTDNYRLALNA